MSFADKLTNIFENADNRQFSYEIQRQRSESKDALMSEVETLAKGYIEEMKPIYARGGEDLIRKHLMKIEDEIVEKLKEKFGSIRIPELIAKLRVLTQGYEYTGDHLTK